MTHIQDATAFAQAIKNKDLSPKEAVQAAIQRIEDKNDDLHAIHHDRFDQALKEAEDFDRFDAPFAGVPIVIKDLAQQLEGGLDSSGSALLKNNQAQATNHFVSRLQDAGFIIVGQTNVPEFGIKFISDSQTFGTVKNPVDSNYHAGGSSGGAAAAVQSGMVPLATASDGGGSIRIPASFSGLIGLKPTTGRMPMGPKAWRSWGGGAVHFALTQTMRDTETLFLHMQTDHYDAMPYRLPRLAASAIDQAKDQVKSLRIGLVNRPAWDSDEAQAALDQMETIFSQAGYDVAWVEPDLDLDRLIETYYQMNAAEMDKILTAIEGRMSQAVQRQDLEPLTWALRQYGQWIKGSEYSTFLDLWDQASYQMSQVFDQVDLMIQPTTTGPAPALNEVLYDDSAIEAIEQADEVSRKEWEAIIKNCLDSANRLSPYALVDNLAGLPAMSLPLWTCQDGRPLGLQLSAPKGREDRLLALGSWLEDHGHLKYY